MKNRAFWGHGMQQGEGRGIAEKSFENLCMDGSCRKKATQ